MKICYLGSELETHFCGIRLVLNELRNRGHEIIEKRWRFGYEKTERTVKDIKADLFLTEMTVPEDEAPYNRPWIQFSHGISPYKGWARAYSIGRWKARLVPTETWTEYGNEYIKHRPLPILEATNGWAKADLYYKSVLNKDIIKAKLCKKYKLDIHKPIIVYAPTGIRYGAEKKIDWQKAGYAKNGYRSHGSYYHRNIVKDTASRYGNYIEIPHPCVNRSDNLGDRINLMAIADVFIGDISSMSLEFTIMNKPMILLKKNIEDQDPMDFRLFAKGINPIIDLGDIISINELNEILKYRLRHDDYKTIRNQWKNLLLGKIDGQASIREADSVEKLAKVLI